MENRKQEHMSSCSPVLEAVLITETSQSHMWHISLHMSLSETQTLKDVADLKRVRQHTRYARYFS